MSPGRWPTTTCSSRRSNSVLTGRSADEPLPESAPRGRPPSASRRRRSRARSPGRCRRSGASQLAGEADAPPQTAGWIHEIKYDGYRTPGLVEAGRVRLYHPQRPRPDPPLRRAWPGRSRRCSTRAPTSTARWRCRTAGRASPRSTCWNRRHPRARGARLHLLRVRPRLPRRLRPLGREAGGAQGGARGAGGAADRRAQRHPAQRARGGRRRCAVRPGEPARPGGHRLFEGRRPSMQARSPPAGRSSGSRSPTSWRSALCPTCRRPLVADRRRGAGRRVGLRLPGRLRHRRRQGPRALMALSKRRSAVPVVPVRRRRARAGRAGLDRADRAIAAARRRSRRGALVFMGNLGPARPRRWRRPSRG